MAASSLLPPAFTEGLLGVLDTLRSLSGFFAREDDLDLDPLSWWQTRPSKQVEHLWTVANKQGDSGRKRVPGGWTRDYVHALRNT